MSTRFVNRGSPEDDSKHISTFGFFFEDPMAEAITAK